MRSLKQYEAVRTTDGDVMAFVDGVPLRRVGLHDPDGYAFGRGPGADELALSILADYFGERPTLEDLYAGNSQAMLYHHDFKWALITPASGSGHLAVTDAEISRWLAERGS